MQYLNKYCFSKNCNIKISIANFSIPKREEADDQALFSCIHFGINPYYKYDYIKPCVNNQKCIYMMLGVYLHHNINITLASKIDSSISIAILFHQRGL